MIVRRLQNNELYHHGIKGQKWGVRRYQNPDGTLTDIGRKRYGTYADYKEVKNLIKNNSEGHNSNYVHNAEAAVYEKSNIVKNVLDDESVKKARDEYKKLNKTFDEYYKNREKYEKMTAEYEYDAFGYGKNQGLSKKQYTEYWLNAGDMDQGSFNSQVIYLASKGINPWKFSEKYDTAIKNYGQAVSNKLNNMPIENPKVPDYGNLSYKYGRNLKDMVKDTIHNYENIYYSEVTGGPDNYNNLMQYMKERNRRVK